MVKNGGRCLLMFLEPVTKHPRGFTNVFLIAIHPITPESIDDPTFSHDRIFVLWGHQEVLGGIASFTMNLHSMPAAYLLEAFTQPSIIRYHNIWFLMVWIVMTSSCGVASFG